MTSPYIMRFGGLKEGRHSFDYELNKEFFIGFDQDDILDAKIVVDVELNKRTTGLDLDFRLKGNFIVSCDRCLEPLDIPVDSEERLLVRFGDEEDYEAEIIILEHKAYELDLKQFLYEFSMLTLPIQRVHDYDCIDESSSENEEEEIDLDPRWEALKNINWKNDK